MLECSFDNPEKRTGRFSLKDADLRNKLYFPLFNDAGLMSAVTPELKGDLKLSQNQFHLHPMITEDLVNAKYSRNFWIVPQSSGEPWSVTGVSADYMLNRVKGRSEQTRITVQPGAFETTRINAALGLRATCRMFVPANGDLCEITVITIKNEGDSSVSFDAVPATPIYARSADNQRDHRQVTTLLSRVYDHAAGLSVCPVMSFDERGHKKNTLHYAVLAFDEHGGTSSEKYERLQDYIGLAGTLESPEAIYKDFNPPKNGSSDGREVIAAYRFKGYTIEPGKSSSFIIINAIAENTADLDRWAASYNTLEKVLAEFESTKTSWQQRVNSIATETGDTDFDNWTRWVTFQPMARKVFGCSFLPDFGYGRGGRGWRDLWQDCLALILTSPDETTQLLFNNFGGVRADGSNATIIGSQPGEFIADRNNISRTWMDHGVWPVLTVDLYLQQSGDLDFLLKNQTYFKDLQSHRSRKKDPNWTPDYGRQLLTTSGAVYEGSILEHMILQTITQFYNVGSHNICQLEGADWNDGLDMAHHNGESVAFHCMFAHNLRLLAGYLEKLRQEKGCETLDLLEESALLFDTIESPINYDSVEAKRDRLDAYMNAVMHKVSGKKKAFSMTDLIADLNKKADRMQDQVLRAEYIKVSGGQQFFNGYYNDDSERVEGDHKNGVRMTLTGQVFPVMSGIADDAQIDEVYAAAKTYLQDPALGGFRLNSDFGDMQLNFGRAFSFSFGDKENGAFFSHMIVMFMNAFYRRGHVRKGYEVFLSLYNMCMDFKTNKILPSIPEYFDSEGRGAYLYLTGSASWMVLTLLTQMFGVKGSWGDLVVEPKLVKEQFEQDASIFAWYAGEKIKVTYHNPNHLDYGDYTIKEIALNGTPLTGILSGNRDAVIPRALFDRTKKTGELNHILVKLG